MPLLLPLAVLVCCAALLLAPRQLLADAGEAREYVDKAHDHLAASDTLAVDNLLRLAEAALDDVAMDEQAPLRSEIEELRRQFESDTTARRARLLVQRIDRLFEDAEMTLGMIEGGGTATLRRIEQLLAEPDSANTLGTTHFEKYRRRLTLFRRAHERKLREKGVAPDLTPRVELEDPDPESRPERPAASAGSNEASTATSPATQPKTPVAKPRLGVEGETKQPAVGNSSQGDVPISDQPRPIYLFGGTQSNASLLSRMWKLLVTVLGAFVVFVKADVGWLFRWNRLDRVRSGINRVPMPAWGLLMTVLGLWWLFDGWIVYGMLVSAGMLAMAAYTTVDALERVGLLGAPAAAGIRKLGLPITVGAITIAVVHLFVGGAWIVV